MNTNLRKIKQLRQELKSYREEGKIERTEARNRKARFLLAVKGDPTKLIQTDIGETVEGDTILPFICKRIIRANEWRPRTIKKLTETLQKVIQHSKIKPNPRLEDKTGIPLIHLIGERGVDLFQVSGGPQF